MQRARHILTAFAALVVSLAFANAAPAQTISKSQTGAIGTVVTATDTSGQSVKAVLPSVVLTSSAGTAAAAVVTNGSTQASAAGLVTNARCQMFNSSTWDACLSGNAVPAASSGSGVKAVAQIPTSAPGAAVAPSFTTVAASSVVAKASAGNLYRVAVNSGASAGFLLVFNATSAPADGTVTPVVCRPVAANDFVEVIYNVPVRFSTGITAVFSTTGCFTKTASATAHIEAEAL